MFVMFERNIHKIKLFTHIFVNVYLYIYMLAIAGQTTGPNWLTLFEETHWYPGAGVPYVKNLIF